MVRITEECFRSGKARYSIPMQREFTSRPLSVAKPQSTRGQTRARRHSAFFVSTRRILTGTETNLRCIFRTLSSTSFMSGDLPPAVSSGMAEPVRGTYAGLIEKIPYLKELGVTIVELMPVHQFDPQEGNYWGYMTLNFFSPHLTYASKPEDAKTEFKEMVKALHAAGIEVILDVVYNHTAEADQWGPTYSFKGIDNASFYLLTNDAERPYADFAGTGNTLNCADPFIRNLILDSLRYWVTEMHVDGFRFDLASILTRSEDGSIDWNDPPLLSAIRTDPVLSRARLIAEPWDAGGAYQLGTSFPGMFWHQWNGKFRITSAVSFEET